jgi:two-component system alkaline phosphatase synthesis response regulator PhoP
MYLVKFAPGGNNVIYLVEDDSNIREFVLYALQGQNMEARGFERPSAFFSALEKQTPDLVLLDLMLPEEDGISVLKRIRRTPATRQVPVIILSARDTEYDKVVGLDNGADDYLPKPFGMMELFSRIRAVLRRADQNKKPEQYLYGELQVLPARRQVLVSGQEVLLTPKEFDILRLLISHPGLVLSRGQIQDQVWGMEYLGETRTVDVHIRTLRQKLGICGELIETVRGVGYRFSSSAG